LIAEKMGPHIAIGDPCFARGEDSPIFNIFDDKEMVARWNEHTLSKKGKDSCYFNLHTDITLPYDEIKSLEGYKDNKLICTFIENGKFVPDFAKELNKNMEEDL
ncbi:MAG: leucyl aminopeptidase, partial [Christensenellaceae bacterium]|nr:leucyl aminopeptidase [Christensenellaceae bacterium]